VHLRGESARVPPQGAAGAGVEGESDVVRPRPVEDAVDDERCRLELAQGSRLVDPLHGQALHAVRVDLREGAPPSTRVVSRVGEPAPDLSAGVPEPLRSHLRGRDRAREDEHCGQARSHWPRSPSRYASRSSSWAALSASSSYTGMSDVWPTAYRSRSFLR